MANQTASIGKAAIIASVLLPLAQVAAPVAQEMYLENRRQQAETAMHGDKHKEQVAKLLLGSYIGHPAKEQQAALIILGGLFNEYVKPLAQALYTLAADDAVEQKLDRIVATTDKVAPDAVDAAREAEHAGFQALAAGDVRSAQTHFEKAYKAYPTYHNVDEIKSALRKVDPADTAAVNRAITTIVTDHSWGMPAGVKEKLVRKTRP